MKNMMTLTRRLAGREWKIENVPVQNNADLVGPTLNDAIAADRQICAMVLHAALVDNALRTPEVFKTVRKLLGIKAKDLAALCGVNKTSMSRWENGTTPIPNGAWNLLLLLAERQDPTSTVANLISPPQKPYSPVTLFNAN